MEVHNITIAQQLMFVVAVEVKMVKIKPEIQTSISVEVTINEGTKVGIAAANKERNVLHFYFKTSRTAGAAGTRLGISKNLTLTVLDATLEGS